MRLFLLLLPVIATGGPIYNVIDLGTLGGPSTQAFGLNSNGVAAGAATDLFGEIHAFSSSGAIVDLGQGFGSAINDAGQIAGTQNSYATIWTNGTAQAVGEAGSYALAINNAGDIAGMNGQGHVLRTVNGVVQDLGTIGSWSSAYSINAAGQIAGYGQTVSGFQAFVWTPGSGFSVLGGANSYAMAINSSGVVAGSEQISTGYMHAFRWNGGTLEDLGTLNGGSSYGYGINGAGDVVGYSGSHAFLFTNGVMLDLNNLIGAGSGWELTEAYSINGSGQIAGAGLFNGVEHAFRLDPQHSATVENFASTTPVPEPATWILGTIGLALVLVGRASMPASRRPRRLS